MDGVPQGADVRNRSELSREEIAHVEVGHTIVSPWLARAIVAWFLIVLAAFPATEWLGARRSTDDPARAVWAHLRELPHGIAERLAALHETDPAATLWTRVVTANRAILAGLTAFETALEDDSPVGRLLRPPAQIVLSGVLGVGNERVYAGRDRWLFYRPDVEYVTGRGFLDPAQLERRSASASEAETPPQPDPRPAIRQFARDLDARGITLIVVPTPVKPTVHPQQLSRAYERRAARSVPSGVGAQNPSYVAFVDELRRDGILVFDPAAELIAIRERSGSPQYLATDTHWRPEAMQHVAEALAAFVHRHVMLPPVPYPGYQVEAREAQQTGDTAAMLDLPAAQQLYPPERVERRFVVSPDGDPWRPLRDADILVLGDSFTNIYSLASMGWGEAAGLVEQLSYILQRPIDRLVQNDRGAAATRALLAREVDGAHDRLMGKRVVIWQFAARELAFGDWTVTALPPPALP